MINGIFNDSASYLRAVALVTRALVTRSDRTGSAGEFMPSGERGANFFTRLARTDFFTGSSMLGRGRFSMFAVQSSGSSFITGSGGTNQLIVNTNRIQLLTGWKILWLFFDS